LAVFIKEMSAEVVFLHSFTIELKILVKYKIVLKSINLDALDAYLLSFYQTTKTVSFLIV